MKIGILTYHRAHNYGAYLQACALCGRLNNEEGIQAEIIDFRMEREAKRYSYHWPIKKRIVHFAAYSFLIEKEKGFERALEDELLVRSEKFLQSDSLEEFRRLVFGKYDAIIAGSDEIWNFNNFRGFPNPYWLLGDLGCAKLSYAASSRQDFEQLKPQDAQMIENTLKEFSFIGVRDWLTYDSIREMMGTDEKLCLCCDPSFLYDFPVGKRDVSELIGEKRGYDPKKKNAFVMMGDRGLARYIRRKLEKSYNLLCVCNRHPGMINVPNLTPREWLELLANCDLVLTTYFHATCFSIIQKRPFLSFASSKRSSKIEDLMETEQLKKHYIKDVDAFIRNDEMTEYIRISRELDFCEEFIMKKRNSFGKLIEVLKKDVDK